MRRKEKANAAARSFGKYRWGERRGRVKCQQRLLSNNPMGRGGGGDNLTQSLGKARADGKGEGDKEGGGRTFPEGH